MTANKETMEKQKKNRLPILLIALAALLLADYFYAHINVKQFLYDTAVDSSDWGVISMMEPQEVEQEFVAEEERYDGVAFQCTTMGDVSGVTLKISLEDEAGKEIASAELPGAEIKSGKFNKVDLSTKVPVKGAKLRLSMQADGVSGENYLVLQTAGKPEESSLTFGGQSLKDQRLVARMLTYRFHLETFIVAAAFVLFIAVFMKFLFKLFAR